MSAFVVQDKTINQVVTWMRTHHQDIPVAMAALEKLGYDITTAEGQKKLGRAMFQLNIKAVSQRYDDHGVEDFRPLDYQFGLAPHATDVQVYKSLRCWLYQCTEGVCPDTELFKVMEDVASALCGHTWTPRITDVRTCPKCRSVFWDRPRTSGNNPSPS